MVYSHKKIIHNLSERYILFNQNVNYFFKLLLCVGSMPLFLGVATALYKDTTNIYVFAVPISLGIYMIYIIFKIFKNRKRLAFLEKEKELMDL